MLDKSELEVKWAYDDDDDGVIGRRDAKNWRQRLRRKYFPLVVLMLLFVAFCNLLSLSSHVIVTVRNVGILLLFR